MNYLSTDHLIVYSFLLITLFIGLRAGRGIKDIREYALANKMYDTGVLVLTFLATNIGGGSVMSSSREIFTNGIIMTVTSLGVVISLLFKSFFIAPKIVYFEGCLTIGDVMGQLYGETSKIITGGLGVLYSICMTSMQLLALAIISEPLLGFKAAYSIIVGGLILATYSAIGGIKSVTITDVFQFLILIAVIPLIASLALNRVGSVQELFQQLPREKFLVFNHKNFSYYLTLFLVWSIFPVGITSPPLFQRMLMGQNAKQLRDQYLIVAAFDPTFRLIIMFIGLAAVVLYPHIEAKNVIPHIVNDLLPTGIKGLAVAGLLAVVMSTADSYLHTAGLLLSHDVIKPLCDKIGVAIHELRWAQYSTIFIGFMAIAIALQAENLLKLSFTALSFTGPLLLFPLVAGIMGLKPDRQSFYVAMLVTLIAFITAMLLLPVSHRHLAVLISILANGTSFFVTHLIKNRGIAVVHRRIKVESTRKPPEKLMLSSNRLIRYSQKKVAQYGAPYALVGVFFCISYTLPYFMWTYQPPREYGLMITIRIIGAIACGLLMAHEKWPDRWRSYLPTFWHLTLLYCLPFVSTVMFLLTQGSIEWVVNIATVIIFLVLLVDWVTFVGLAMLGIALGLLFYRYFTGEYYVSLDFDAKYLLVYQAIFATLIGLLFARRKQQRFDKLSTRTQALMSDNLEDKKSLLEAFREKIRIIQTLKHAGIQDLLKVVKHIKELRIKAREQALPLLETVTQLEATFIPMTLQLRRIEERVTNFLRLEVAQLSLQNFLGKLQVYLVTKGIDKRVRFRINTQVEVLECDSQRLLTLLISSITALQVGSGCTTILVGIEDTELHYALPSVRSGYTKKVAAFRFTVTTQSRLPALQSTYPATLNGAAFTIPETIQELTLFDNQRIVSAHYGYMEATAGMLYYVIPQKLRAVRPREMDVIHMELGTVPTRANDAFPGAQAQEAVFLRAVQSNSTIDLEVVKSVLELIKWYHGPMKRQTGEPYYLHPLAVAQIVLDYNQDEATILAALLHDTVEDTTMLLGDIEAVFGKETAGIVDTVTHLESGEDSFYKIKLSAEENILMLLASGDDRAMYVKLADRIHNMRTIQGQSAESQVRIAEETLQFFVPQAQRLDLHEAAKELRDRSLEVLKKIADET